MSVLDGGEDLGIRARRLRVSFPDPRPLPSSEPKLRALFDKLATHGPLLVVVDQPIGALPVAVARAAGHQVASLPGLAMRRIADLYPCGAKTDARDAFIIADAARYLPHTLWPVGVGDETLAELNLLVGFDDDLAGKPPGSPTASAAAAKSE